MGSSDLAETWIVAPFRGPLDALFDRVLAIETGWEEQGTMREPVGRVTSDYLAALVQARTDMESAMAATWSREEWRAYVQEATGTPHGELHEQIAQAEFDLVQTWNAQMVHACGLHHHLHRAASSAASFFSMPAPAGLS